VTLHVDTLLPNLHASFGAKCSTRTSRPLLSQAIYQG
jgi:hypothetical protein